MTALIILNKNQSDYFAETIKVISSMDVKPEIVIVIADRPKVIEWNKIKSVSESIKATAIKMTEIPERIQRPDISGDSDPFLAGHCRNIGIKHAIEMGATNFVFIDGDCIPETNLIKSHKMVLDTNEPVVTIGRRIEAKHGYKDQREVAVRTAMFKWFGPEPKRIHSERSIMASGVVWSCNLGMNLTAVNAIQAFNKHLYGRSEVFSSQFTGKWGGEDGFLGIQLFRLGIPIVTAPVLDKSAVYHKEHDRPNHKYSQEEFDSYLKEQTALMEYLLCNNPMPWRHVL